VTDNTISAGVKVHMGDGTDQKKQEEEDIKHEEDTLLQYTWRWKGKK
jgi:hypothetical protein